MKLRIYHSLRGSHVHCRVFVNGAKSGELVFRAEEWAAFIAAWGPGSRSRGFGDFLCELVQEDTQ